MHELLENTAAALRRRGFEAHVFASSQEAAAFLVGAVPEGEAVGIGGSMTVREMGLDALLEQAGHPVLWHWNARGRSDILKEAMNAPNYLLSANAVTEDGLIVQVDGNGNRVGAMCFGPKTVYLVIGRNKIVSGGCEDAVRRIREVAAPLNAQRLGLIPAAGKEGGAQSVASKIDAICRITAAFDRAPSGKRTVVLLIDENLGY